MRSEINSLVTVLQGVERTRRSGTVDEGVGQVVLGLPQLSGDGLDEDGTKTAPQKTPGCRPLSTAVKAAGNRLPMLADWLNREVGRAQLDRTTPEQIPLGCG